MSELHRLDDVLLGHALRDVAEDVEYPSTPNLSLSVRRRIDAGEGERSLRIASRPRWQTAVVVVGIVVVAFIGVISFSPTARQAVADLLGVAGIHIQLEGDSDVPSPTGSPDLEDVDLGDPVTFQEAQDYVDFLASLPIALPQEPQVYLDRSVPGGMINLLYPSRQGDVLVTQFAASLDEGYFKKIGASGELTYPRVGTAQGYWIDGAHEFYYVDADGEFLPDTVRIAGPVLLWEQDGITYRVEGADSMPEALEIATSL